MTVANGETSAIERLATYLSSQRYRMFPIQENEPGWPRAESSEAPTLLGPGDDLDEDSGTEDADETELDDLASPSISGSALFGSSSSFRRPAIREEVPRRVLRGAAARAHARKQQRESADK